MGTFGVGPNPFQSEEKTQMPTAHTLNCARLRPHREGENAYPCSCGATRTAQKVHNHGPDSGRGLDCPEYTLTTGELRGHCVLTREEKVTLGLLPDYKEAVVVDLLSNHPDLEPRNPDSFGKELASWWQGKSEAEVAGLVAKATEYGGAHRASDLIQLGRDLAELINPDYVSGHTEYTDGQLQELACYFYLKGKLGRWHAALLEGRAVSDDTLHDILVYTRMVQRIRDVGGWPV